MREHKLPDNVYSQQYLKSCGVRFHYNAVDSAVKKGLGLSFYLVLGFFVLISLASGADEYFSFEGARLYQRLLQLLSLAYLCLTLGKYLYYLNVRKRLRRDPLSIAAEAYAVVLLDERQPAWLRRLPFVSCKSAIVYRECGTHQPRFFLGAAHCRILPPFTQDLLVRVFIDRRNEKLYSVDEDSAVQPQSVRASRVLGINLGRAAGGVQSKEGGL